MAKEIEEMLSSRKELLEKLEKEVISFSSADPEKYRQSVEKYVKQAVKLNGQEIPDLKVEKVE